jgi:hypothetical protein
VSLVLEALKKLEREKGRDERGFVVMAAAPWPTRSGSRWPAFAAAGALAVAAGAATLVALRPPAPPPTPSTRAEAPAAVAEPQPSPVAAAPAPLPTAAAPARRVPAASVPDAPPAAAIVPPPEERPAPASPAADAVWRLQAITERDGQPIAVISGHIVRVGDEVDGLRVLAIRGTEVDVEIRGRRATLRF